jgi:hypothetical protein
MVKKMISKKRNPSINKLKYGKKTKRRQKTKRQQKTKRRQKTKRQQKTKRRQKTKRQQKGGSGIVRRFDWILKSFTDIREKMSKRSASNGSPRGSVKKRKTGEDTVVTVETVECGICYEGKIEQNPFISLPHEQSNIKCELNKFHQECIISNFNCAHVKNSLLCPNCRDEIKFEELFPDVSRIRAIKSKRLKIAELNKQEALEKQISLEELKDANEKVKFANTEYLKAIEKEVAQRLIDEEQILSEYAYNSADYSA